MAATLFARAKGLLGLPTETSAEARPVVPARKTINRHHAVSIAPGPRCCAAARELGEERFLSSEAPPLPLAGCDRTECRCRYEHHPDRRKGPRRARDMGVAIDGWVETENREPRKRGRRNDDSGASGK